MVVVDGSRDTWINDFCEEIVQGLEKVFRENAEHCKEVLRHERWRVAKKREQIKKNVSEQKQEWTEKQVGRAKTKYIFEISVFSAFQRYRSRLFIPRLTP